MPPCDLLVLPSVVVAAYVSILVLMDAALRPRFRHHEELYMFYVSILVLMDAALRPCNIMKISISIIPGFNPCFDGCRPATCLSFRYAMFH